MNTWRTEEDLMKHHSLPDEKAFYSEFYREDISNENYTHT